MKSKTVLITGSSSGIGRETAYRFAEEGARVITRGKPGASQAKDAARALGPWMPFFSIWT